MGICKTDCIWVEGENVMPELNFKLKISGGKKLGTVIDVIPQSVTGDKAIKLQNGKEISEPEIAKLIKNYLQGELI